MYVLVLCVYLITYTYAVDLPTNMQLQPNQVKAILDKLPENGNILVWGVGHDSVFWQSSTKGRVVFLEDHPKWHKQIQDKYPQLEIYKVTYNTSMEHRKKHLKDSFRSLSIYDQLHESIKLQYWDVIIVDAPCGYSYTCPGRFSSIVTSKQLDSSYVFIDDVHRPVEDMMMRRIFGPPIKIYDNRARNSKMALASSKHQNNYNLEL